jgi:deoxycytidine triphosphate deaminase
MTILTRQSIEQLGIIDGAEPAQFREVGYDLTVGGIYVPENDDTNAGSYVTEDYDIPPHGIILLFSRESIDVPAGICGFAMPKTRLCEEGILVLNTGILDPNYRGHISGTAINFRKTPYRIRRGDSFLRLVFEPTSTLEQTRYNAPRPLLPNAMLNYRNDKMVKAQQYGNSFLNLKPLIRTLAEQVTGDLLTRDRRFLGFLIGAAALFFTALQVFTPSIVKLTSSEELVNSRTLNDFRANSALETGALKAQLEVQLQMIQTLRKQLAEQEAAMKTKLPSALTNPTPGRP